LSEPPPNSHPTTTIGLASSISERLIRVLPPAFLLLVILNLVFLGTAMWVFAHNTDTRNVLLTKIIERCLDQPPPGHGGGR
jgi:hypothetical protein